MNNLNDKLWFVYMGDHHEGPFSLTEIQEKLQSSQLNTSYYVWKEGMTDWKMLTEVPECSEILTRTNTNTTNGGGGTHGTQPSITTTQEIQPNDFKLEERLEIPDVAVPKEAEPVSSGGIPELEVPTQTKSKSYSATAGQQTSSKIKAVSTPVLATPTIPTEARVEVQTSSNPIFVAEPTGMSKWMGSFKNLFDKMKTRRSTGAAESSYSRIPSARPEKKSSNKFLLLILMVGAVFGAYKMGYLDEVLNHPAGKAAKSTVAGMARPLSTKVGDYLPFLKKYLSPIPELQDVNPQDYEELKLAASADLKEQGIKVATALTTSDPRGGVFYLGSNLPDGAQFEVRAIGQYGTLLNQLEASGSSSLILTQHLGRSTALKTMNGQPIPRGQYTVYFYDGLTQPDTVRAALASSNSNGITMAPSIPSGRKATIMRTYFLGGPKDQTYFSRLNSFNKKIQDRAKKELDEMKNFSSTLVSQYKTTASSFVGLSKGKKSKKKTAEWNKFSSKWSKLDKDLRKASDRWTPDVLEKGYFYGSLYSVTRTAAADLSQLHHVQDQYFSKKTLSKNYSDELTAAVGKAKESLRVMMQKIDETAKLPLTETGMPQKLK